MIFYGQGQRTKRKRARDGQPMLASSSVRLQRKYSCLTGKETRKIKNAHRRHRKGIDKSSIHWTDKPTRKDITRQTKRMADANKRHRRKRGGWLW